MSLQDSLNNVFAVLARASCFYVFSIRHLQSGIPKIIKKRERLAQREVLKSQKLNPQGIQSREFQEVGGQNHLTWKHRFLSHIRLLIMLP